MQEGQEPGQLIVPHPPETPAPAPAEAAKPPVAPASPAYASENPAPASLPQPQFQQPVPQPTPAPVAPVATQQLFEPATDWKFTQETDPTAPGTNEPQPEGLTWTAAEFIAHDKGFAWYAALALGGAVGTMLIYLLTKDKVTSAIIIFALITFGVFASRKPREEQYALTPQGIQVGNKSFAFHDFKTFSIADEGSAASVVLMPLKRFMPALTIYVTQDVEEQVVDFLSFYLPFSQHKTDAVDGLLRRIHF